MSGLQDQNILFEGVKTFGLEDQNIMFEGVETLGLWVSKQSFVLSKIFFLRQKICLFSSYTL